MNGDHYSITRAEGGFIVYVTKQNEPVPDTMSSFPSQPMVFTDSSVLINFLHNELVRSN